MQVAIIHLTDIHLTTNSSISEKISKVCQAIKNDLINIENLYIILSGDIVNTGLEEEFTKAKSQIGVLKTLLKESVNKIQFVVVPGNHDCNFEDESQIRKILIDSINDKKLGEDNSIIDEFMKVQTNFWNFYKAINNNAPKDKLYYKINDEVGDFKICFHCFNTSWISQINEKPASLFFPVKKYKNSISLDSNSLNIAVYHHPVSWFNPNTENNNKKELKNLIEETSQLQFFGHEHVNENYKVENLTSSNITHEFSGQIFHTHKNSSLSGFQLAIIDIENKNGKIKIFNLDDSIYSCKKEHPIDLNIVENNSFEINSSYEISSNEIKIPLSIPNKKDVKLSDIFIYQDLDIIDTKESKKVDDYFDSRNIINDNKLNFLILEGESQVGKSSLLKMIYLETYKNGIVPLLINGQEIKDSNILKFIKKNYEIQFNLKKNNYEIYSQLDKSKKILLIDDFHLSDLKSKEIQNILDNLTKMFHKVIITIDSTHAILPQMQFDKSYQNFKIKPLGYKKRNELITRYHLLKENNLTGEDFQLIENTKNSFDEVQKVMGNKLMPPLPIYILSILQSLDFKSLQLNETSYGYCYQTLIHYSLSRAGIKNEDIDSYVNFLTELAYHFIDKNLEFLSDYEFEEFVLGYRKKFIIGSFEKLRDSLIESKLIQYNEHTIKFSYKYIVYYLSAKKISEIIHTTEGENIINKLFKELHIEKNANILVFITHHSKDVTFIEHSILNSMLILENGPLITLEKNDPFYKIIEDISLKVSSKFIDSNRTPNSEREKLINEQDKLEREREIDDDDDDDDESAVLPFRQAFRSIEIVGQIIKNRKGSLEISKLEEMIMELYTTGFRTIYYCSEMINNAEKNITHAILKDLKKGDDKQAILKKVNYFFQIMSLKICIGVFAKLTSAIGHKDLRTIFIGVGKKMNTPASKLVSFSINSYYNTISVEELKSLVKEYKDNAVVMHILRARVKSYIYNRNSDYKTKTKLMECAGLTYNK